MYFSKEDKEYEKMTKAQLIKVIKDKEAQIDYLENNNYYFIEENERNRRKLFDLKEKEKKEELYKLFPGMNQTLGNE